MLCIASVEMTMVEIAALIICGGVYFEWGGGFFILSRDAVY